ncbi:hemagglutinin repeat-containing protein [uncultured Sphingomonas sp.]|uniref:two-partner secretion domain-containing protein n=1 Tax=uncultured Sphingomonas sp. TaxID=158754 RepID=UPI0025E63EB3|nr:hemagglutinin repeat-containing protein [uncultured Sphingomonas sp.]
MPARRALSGTALSPLSPASAANSASLGLPRCGGNRALHGALILALLSGSLPASAQTVAPSSVVPVAAPQGPAVGVAANGTPIVKIAAPNATGLSHNRYTDLNVDGRGLILNNSNKIVQTQLGGYVDGNGNLKYSGPASIILNEVVGSNRSTLSGYVEVAGQAAQVIVANSNGISCSACGFINTRWATLATGTPKIGPDGSLTGFAVERGTLSVDGAGLDASGMRLDLLARAIEVNAGIWADRVNASAGVADVTIGATRADEIRIIPRASDTAGNAAEPARRFALDVAALGGMYARSIRLIGTEAGLGVRVDGNLASIDQDFVLTSAGAIRLAGKVTAATNATIQSGGAIEIPGTFYAGQSLQLAGSGTTIVSGIAGAGQALAIDSGELRSTGTLAAGLGQDGNFGSSGSLRLTSSGTTILSGQTLSAGSAHLSAATLDLTGGLVQAATTSLAADRFSQASAGRLLVAGTLGLRTGSGINAGLIQAGPLGLSGGDFANGGTIASGDALRLSLTGTLANHGIIQSSRDLDAMAGGINNDGGTIADLSDGTLLLVAQGRVSSRGGTIGGNGQLVLNAAALDVGGQGRLSAVGRLYADVRGAIQSDDGLIASGADMALDFGSLTGPRTALSAGGGAILSGGALAMQDGRIAASGLDIAVVTADLAGAKLEQSGYTAASILAGTSLDLSRAELGANGRDLTIRAGMLTASDARIDHAGAGRVTLQADKLAAARAGIATAGTLDLAVAGAAIVPGASIAANGDAAVRAAMLDLSGEGARLTAAGMLSLQVAGDLAADKALIASGGNMDLRIGGNINAHALALSSTAKLALHGGDMVLNGASLAADNLSVEARSVALRGGNITQSGTAGMRLDVSDILDLTDARLHANAEGAEIGAGILYHDRAILQHSGTGTLDLSARDVLANDGGLIATNGMLRLSAGSVSNLVGQISSQGDMDAVVRGAIVNGGGNMLAGGHLVLAGGDVANARGTIEAAGSVSATLASLSGAAGAIKSTGSRLELVASGAVDARGGVVGATGAATVFAGSIDVGRDGLLFSGTTLYVNAGAGGIRADQSGLISGTYVMLRSGGAIDLTAGALQAARSLTVTAAGTLIVDQGHIVADRFAIDTASLSNVDGRIAATGAGASRIVVGGVAVNDGGIIQANGGDLTLSAVSLANGSGTIAHAGAGTLQLTAAEVISSSGSIATNGALRLNADSLTNSGTLSALGMANIKVAGAITNRAGLIASGAGLNLAAGRLENGIGMSAAGTSNVSGSIVASGNGAMTVTVDGAVASRGGIIGGNGAVTVTARSIDLGGEGQLSAKGALAVTTTGGDLRTDQGGLVAAGGVMTLAVAGNINASAAGAIESAGRTTIAATAVDLTGGSLVADELEMALTGDLMVGTAARLVQTNSAGLFSLTADAIRLDKGAIEVNAANASLAAALLDNQAGDLLHHGDGLVTLDIGRVTNNGQIAGNGALALTGTSLTNRATISAVGDAAIRLTQALDNSQGKLLASGRVDLAADSIDNRAGTISGTTGLAIDAASLLNGAAGQLLAGDFTTSTDRSVLRLTLGGELQGAGGLVAATGQAEAGATDIDLGSGGRITGDIVKATAAAGDFLAKGGTIDGRLVTLTTGGTLSIAADGLIQADALTLSAATLDSSAGTLIAGSLAATLGGIVNRGGTISVTATDPLVLQVSGALNNGADGLIQTNARDFTLRAASIANDGGTIAHAGSGLLTVASTGALANGGGTIAGNGALQLDAASLANAGGSITAAGSGTVTAVGTIGNGGGTIAAGAGLTLGASAIDDQGGILSAGGALSATAGSLDNRGGALVNGSGTMTLALGSFSNGSAGGRAGLVSAGGALSLSASSVDNGGEISADSAITARLSGAFANAGGELTAGSGLALEAASFANGGGLVNGGGAIGLTIGGALDNGSGSIGGPGALTLSADSISNGGTLASGGPMYFTATGGIVNSGAIWSDADGTLNASEVRNSGSIGTGGHLTVNAPLIQSGAGVFEGKSGVTLVFDGGPTAGETGGGTEIGDVGSDGNITLSFAGDWTNEAGKFQSGGDVTIHTGGAFTNQGTIEATGTATLSSSGNFLNDAGGRITANNLNLTASGMLTNGGTIEALQATIGADELANLAGGQIKGDALTLTTTGLLDNAGLISGGNGSQAATLISAGGIANSGKIYGNSLTLTTPGNLSNSGTIASRAGLLAIRAGGNFGNSGTMLAMGDLEISGGGGSGTRAALIRNEGGLIQAQGNILLQAGSVVNNRPNLTTTTETYTEDSYSQAPTSVGGNGAVLFAEYHDEGTKTVLVADSVAGRIIAGGSIAIGADSLDNLYSQIAAGGSFSFNSSGIASTEADFSRDGLVNRGLTGTKTVLRTGTEEVWFGCPAGCDTRTRTIAPTTVTESFVIAPASITAGAVLTIDAGTISNDWRNGVGQPSSPGGDNSGGGSGGGTTTPGTGTGTDIGIGPQPGNVSPTPYPAGSQTAFEPANPNNVGGAAGGTPRDGVTGVGPLGSSAAATAQASGRTLADGSIASGRAGDGTTNVTLGSSSWGKLGNAAAVSSSWSAMVAAAGGAGSLGQLVGVSAATASTFRLPMGGLFGVAQPGKGYVIETDPAFTDAATYLSSDYFLAKLGYDPGRVQQRLADAMAEQQLITQQLLALTGRNLLSSYASAEQQYRALLDAGAAYAQRFSLGLGIGLSSEQMATLTSDIVLLVEVTVQTPAGPQKALAPVLYLARVHAGDLSSTGALIAGDTLTIRSAGALTNSGTIRAVTASDIRAGGSLTNSGNIQGGSLSRIEAVGDLINRGGSISGGNLTVTAGRDLIVETTTQRVATAWQTPTRGGATTATIVDRTGSITATGSLVVSAGRDVAVTAGTISASGNAAISAGRDISLAPVAVTSSDSESYKQGKRSSSATTTTLANIGSSLTSGGGMTVSAGRDLTVAGSSIAADGKLAAAAGRDLSVIGVINQSAASAAGKTKKSSRNETSSDQTVVGGSLSGGAGVMAGAGNVLTIKGSNLVSKDGAVTLSGVQGVSIGTIAEVDSGSLDARKKKPGLLSSKKTTTHDAWDSSTAVGSTVSGDTVAIISGAGSVGISGSNVLASNGITIGAAKDVSIGGAENTSHQEHSDAVKKSGISIGSSGLFAGVAKGSNGSTTDAVSHSGSFVGAEAGNLSIKAGNTATLSGSSLVAPGTLTVHGQDVKVETVTDMVTSTSQTRSSSTGLSVKLYENVTGAVKTVVGTADRIGEGGQGAAGTAITTASEVTRSVGSVLGAVTNAAGIAVSVGTSKSSASGKSRISESVGSTIVGGDVALVAGRDLSVRGSEMSARDDLALAAGRDITIESAQNSADSESRNKDSGFGMGVNLGVGIAGGVTASGSVNVSASKGHSASSATTQSNSHVTAGGTLVIASGNDTKLAGAVATGRDVIVDVGGDLMVQSRQDTSTGSSSRGGLSAGLSLSAGATDGPNGVAAGQSQAGGNFGVSVGKGLSDSAVVTEQTGMIAKGGTLDASVGGTTTLVGGMLAAVDGQGKDSGKLDLVTNRMEVSDVTDTAKSKDISLGVSANINDMAEKGIKGASSLVIDGSYASSNFARETRGTIGQGKVTVGDTSNGTALAQVNRDVAKAREVTKDKQNGLTVYADEAAIRETAGLATGDFNNSVIAGAVSDLAKDPLAAVKDAAKEIRSLGDGKTDNGALDTLADRVDSIMPGYIERKASSQTEGMKKALVEKGYTPEQIAEVVQRMADKDVPTLSAKLEWELNQAGREFQLPPQRQAQLRAEIEAFIKTGDTSAGSAKALESRMQAIVEPDITITGQRTSSYARIARAAVNTVEAVGETVNTAPAWMKTAFGVATTAMGGLSGIVTSTTLQLSGIGEKLEQGKEIVTVGSDAVLRGNGFDRVYAENQEKSSENPTYNQTTGIGVVADATLAAVGGARIVNAAEKILPSPPPQLSEILRKTPTTEYQAVILTKWREWANENGLKKDNVVSRKNPSREIYRLSSGGYLSIDKLHGTTEIYDKKGVHKGEITEDGTLENIDRSGRHDIRI